MYTALAERDDLVRRECLGDPIGNGLDRVEQDTFALVHIRNSEIEHRDVTALITRARYFVEPLLLLLIAPFALFPTPVRFIALLAIPALWAGRWMVSRNQPSAISLLPSAHFISRTGFDWRILPLVREEYAR